ncbi:MAG TPA: response regulator [Lachnospiraceae bacterium]|nr:response regulator [Lachnospiraceae bacterium]
MYKVMLADDEGIVIDSLKFIIEKHFGDVCQVEFAKTGRHVIELAESYRPDIAIMDIQMPGINGIDAMKEIRKANAATIFIVLSAYDKFDYAKEAINLGVLEYLNKPVEQRRIVEVLKKAMNIINREREKRSNDLIIKEKLETVVPIIENNMIYTILFQDNYEEEIDNFKNLLVITEDYGFFIVLEYGESQEGNHLTNVVGASVRTQSYYKELREIVKEFFVCVIGSLMANRVIVFVPYEKSVLDYNERIEIIEKTRSMIKKLNAHIDVKFRAGIGSTQKLHDCMESYKEAQRALRNTDGTVAHIKDLPVTVSYEEDYPIETEKELFEMTEKGNENGALVAANHFFDWMVEKYADHITDVKLKALEFVLWAEHLAYEEGGMTYHFLSRQDYLPAILNMQSLDEIKAWFISKILSACRNVVQDKEKQYTSSVEKAKAYMTERYNKDISLDDVSREVDISPYYFSKLFKEETGENFIEYLTGIRIEKAKQLLSGSTLPMKEICAAVGYSDPNYFSRIFKKNVGVTPTEFKEGMTG